MCARGPKKADFWEVERDQDELGDDVVDADLGSNLGTGLEHKGLVLPADELGLRLGLELEFALGLELG